MVIQNDADIGRLAIDYSANEQKIEWLRSSIKSKGLDIQQLGSDLWQFPDEVVLKGDVLRLRHAAKEIPVGILARLAEAMTKFQSAVAEKERMENELRAAGLDVLIKS